MHSFCLRRTPWGHPSCENRGDFSGHVRQGDARNSFVQKKDLMVSAALGFPWFTASLFSLPLKEGGELLNRSMKREQPLLCIEPLNITATGWLLTNSFRLWSALGSHESHWLQARHNNPEQGTVTASFVNNGTSTSAISATEKQWQIIKFLPRRKLL